MNKDKAINQLQSLRESTAAYARGNDDPVFREDIEALDAAIYFLNSGDRGGIPTGEWIYDSRCGEPRCSVCGEDAICGEITPYCPNCGAEMMETDA
mgnify:CR=1 FL=1